MVRASNNIIKLRKLEKHISVQHIDVHTLTVSDAKTISPDIIITSAAAGPLFIVKLFTLACLSTTKYIFCNLEHITHLKVINK